MFSSRKFALVVSLTSVLLSARSFAQTGLVVMPVADILRNREAAFELSLAGNERNVSKGYEYANALTVGLFDRLEIGYESDLLGVTTANVKLLLFENPHALPHFALSVGASDWRGSEVDPYAVARFDGAGYRLHAGCWRTLGSMRAMMGVDAPAGAGLTASLECLSGCGGAAWAGLVYAPSFAPGFEAEFAIGVPWNHSEGVQHALTLAYLFKI